MYPLHKTKLLTLLYIQVHCGDVSADLLARLGRAVCNRLVGPALHQSRGQTPGQGDPPEQQQQDEINWSVAVVFPNLFSSLDLSVLLS